MTFQVVLEPGGDGWIVAECPALPGCVSQGRTEAEAIDNIREAIELWLETELEIRATQHETRATQHSSSTGSINEARVSGRQHVAPRVSVGLCDEKHI